MIPRFVLPLSSIFLIVFASPVLGAGLCGCPAGCPVCEPLQVSMDASLSKNVLEYGESANVSVSVRNSEPNITALPCTYTVDGQNGGPADVTNDGVMHQIGQFQVTAPEGVVDHQVAVGVSADVSCTAQLSNDTGLAWCGNGCSSFAMVYYYPGSGTIAAYREAQLGAVNKFSLAKTAFAAAESMISKAESVNPASSYLNSSREKLTIADGFLTTASFMYDQLNFNATITNSESALLYSQQAEYMAYLAYGAASPATSYSYVLRLIEETQQKGGHTHDEIKSITDTLNSITGISGGVGGGVFKKALEDEKKNLDEANRLLDEARKKLKEGDYVGAVKDAVTAKSLVEKAKEVLDSLFVSVKNGFVIAIENAYKSLLADMDGISAKMDAASKQTGVNLEEIKLGRNSIDYARFRLIGTAALVKDVRNANDIAGLLEASSSAVLELRSARSYVQDAAFHAYLSLMKRYTAVGIIAVGAALLGTLIWWIEKKKEWAGQPPTVKEVSAEKQKPMNPHEEVTLTGELANRPAKVKVRRPSSKQKGSRPAKKKAKPAK